MSARTTAVCRICDSPGRHNVFVVREMMLGTRDPFEYFECRDCGCLQIVSVPDDLARYYPPTYYSLSSDSPGARRGRIAHFLRGRRNRAAVLGGRGLGRLLARFFPEPVLESLALVPLTFDSAILDVGCGTGVHLRALQQIGFTNLLGVDPNIQSDLDHPPRVVVKKAQVHDVSPRSAWDLVTFHHSFEHVLDPIDQLRCVRDLLKPNGVCLIRIPVMKSEAWERYGVDWVQLDAPRHLFLHTIRSMEVVAAKAGLRVDRVVYDSTAFQFWGSEQYRMDVPLHADSDVGAWTRRTFSRRQMRAFEREAALLNRLGRGDQAAFILRRVP